MASERTLTEATIIVNDPLHRLTEAQLNFALDLYNMRWNEDSNVHQASVTMTHIIGEGCYCEIHEDGGYMWCMVNINGYVEGDWIV